MDSENDPLTNRSVPDLQAAPLVLIVDDEAPIAQALAFIVEDAGYTALTAYRGQEGLDLARERHPALVITDMMMPQVNGAALIAALRADAETDHWKAPVIIAMTAGGMLHAEASGADAVLQKPFSLDDVESLLARFLSHDGR